MASAHSEAAKTEQIITEFFAKALQIITEARSGRLSSRNYRLNHQVLASARPRDKWFNLALRECPPALVNNHFLSRNNNHDPMVVDVILVQRPLVMNLDRVEFSECEAKSEKVLERWVVQYQSRKSTDQGSKRSSNSNLYKKTILLLRSLYVTVRLLPAYKIYHDLNLCGRISPCTLTHRVSSFAEPFTRREEAELKRFEFAAVDTWTGRLCLSVMYRCSLSGVISPESWTPLPSRVISDYVGSPLVDRAKRFPSRRHSWGFDIDHSERPQHCSILRTESAPIRIPATPKLEFEESDCKCPFVDEQNHGNRTREAEVGALVLMLRKAQESGCVETGRHSKTSAADALEELEGFRHLKNVIEGRATQSKSLI